VLWCAIFTRRDLELAVQGCQFERLADEPAGRLRARSPARRSYPSTGWYEGWSGAKNLFDLPAERPPMEFALARIPKDELTLARGSW